MSIAETSDNTSVSQRRAGMRYENAYVWLIFVSALDIMLTWVVLYRSGQEANVIAAAVIRHFGLPGMVVFKFVLVVLVIGICEALGRRNVATGRTFARCAVLLSAVPVVVGLALLLIRR